MKNKGNENRKRNTEFHNSTVTSKTSTGATRDSSKRFQIIFEAVEEGIAIHDNGVIIEANQVLARMFGYELSELIGMQAKKLTTPESWEIIKKNISAKYDKPYEGLAVRKDSSTFICSLAGKLYKYKGKTLRLATFIDITDRKNKENKLMKSELFFREITEHSSDIIIIIDKQNTIKYCSPSMERFTGYQSEEVIGKSARSYIHKDDLERAAAEYKEALLKRDVYSPQNPFRIIHKDGSARYFDGTGKILLDNPDIEGVVMNVHDVTNRKLAEDSLRKSEEKYRLLAEHTKDQIWLMDLSLKITYISPSAEKLMGYTQDEFKELPIDKLLTATSFKTAMDFFSIEMSKALSATPDYVLNRKLELEYLCKNGQTVWGEASFTFIRDEKGKPVSILGESRNITERKKMENDLRESKENFRRSLDESPLGVRISTIEGKTLYANKAILDIYGYDNVGELISTPLRERYTPESFAEFQQRKEKRLKGELGPSEYEISVVRKDGKIRHLNVLRKGIFWNGEKHSQVIYQDITLRRQAENKLIEILENLRQSIKTTIQVLGTASEAKDPYMAGHQKRVADLARAIATEMKLPHDKIEAIRMASAIHDIGKISIPSEILCKPAILSDLEFSLVKGHSQYGYDIIKDVESPWPLAEIIYQHHERLNGSGYPLGLKSADILIESRILAVADVVEAMISYRPYRPALGIEIALAEIENNTGVLYDPDVVKACVKLFREKGYQMI